MNPSLNWKYLPGAITEVVIELKLKWSVDLRARRLILRQARLTDFKTPTAYLLQTLELTTMGVRSSPITAGKP